MRRAAIDIGTNSCRLLIADLEDGKLQPVHRELQTTRIGEGVSQTGTIHSAAMDRTLHCLTHFQENILQYGAVDYKAVATSAVREAENQDLFVARAQQEAGTKVDIIPGQEEAYLSYLGVKNGLSLGMDPLVVDLGGGSTEFISCGAVFSISLPIGAVRASEGEWTDQDINQRLQAISSQKEQFDSFPLVFVGGTASSLIAVKLALEPYDSEKVHGQKLSIQEVSDLYQLLENTPLPLRRKLPGLQPERADIINKGALIILMIMKFLGKKEMQVSDHDLLQGMLYEKK